MRALRGQLIAVMAASGLAVAGLVGAGSGALAGPPGASWSAVEGWYGQVGAARAALVGLRLVALVGAAWIFGASGLQLLAGLSPACALQWVADAVSPLGLRRLAHGVAGVSVTVALVGPPAPTDPTGTAVMEVLGEVQPATTQAPTTQAPTTQAPTTQAPTTPPPVTEPTPTAPPPPDEEVVVEPGDSFWSLAVDAVGDRAGPAAVDDYWRRLIARNRARLVDPGNPDLLYPGQVLVLPPNEG